MSARSRLLLDLAMFVALVVAFNPGWTGLAVHEWLAVAVIVPLLLHLIVNWEQTVRFVETFVDRLRNKSRVDLGVDVALFVSATAVMLSGLMISQAVAAFLGVTIVPSALWVAVHAVTANLTIALLLAHFALHWRWVLGVSRRLLSAPPRTQEER